VSARETPAVPSALETAGTLRRAGRQPPLPLRIALEDGRILTLHRLFRILPAKRLVGMGELEGATVLAKLFIARRGSERHWRQELDGIEALAAQDLATPRLLGSGRLGVGGHYLLTEFLDDAESLADAWQAVEPGLLRDGAAALAVAGAAVEALARMHARGLTQTDLHLGNFLRRNGTVYLIDGDAVHAEHPGRPLGAAAAMRNLAILLAQLPPAADPLVPALLERYRAAHPAARPDAPLLAEEMARVRAWRLRDYLAKSLRDCSLFKVEQRRDRFTAVVRTEAQWLAPLVDDPDRWLAAGRMLKDGGTCTVTLAEIEGRRVVIKRYNIKSTGHALSRFWRPSRAWHSWVEGHRLHFLGIATPRPLALVERRFGPLRGRAWLVTEYCGGPDLLAHLDAQHEPPEAEGTSLRALLGGLHRERISHGDLKATNLLWDGERVTIIDLDAMRQHGSAAGHAKAWRKDRARLLRNWPAESALHRWLEANLPPA